MKKLNQKGFSVVEGLLILIIVAIIGFVGWYVFKTRNNTSQSYKNASTGVESSNQKKTPVASEVVTYTSWASTPRDIQQAVLTSWNKTNKACDVAQQITKDNPIRTESDAYILVGIMGCDGIGGSNHLIVKVAGAWQEVAATSNAYSCSILTQYHVPINLVAQCLQPDGTNKNLKN